jgi:hypothetical protein
MKINPCKKCGNDDIITLNEWCQDDRFEPFYIGYQRHCNSSKCDNQTDFYTSKNQATKAWNAANPIIANPVKESTANE